VKTGTIFLYTSVLFFCKKETKRIYACLIFKTLLDAFSAIPIFSQVELKKKL